MGCRMVSEEQSPKRPPIQSRLQKRKRSGKIKATVKRLRVEMVEIAEQQQRIREGQVEVRKKFEEIDFECGQLQKETILISQQAESNQQRLTLMFKILKARAENNFHEAARLTHSLRECMRSGTQSSSQVAVDERGTV
ncbi:golgin subfamily member protein [Salix suchowensis]|nr:golgin subfamily member protein [Salix suchowensis]